jgi:hypothetical protein
MNKDNLEKFLGGFLKFLGGFLALPVFIGVVSSIAWGANNYPITTAVLVILVISTIVGLNNVYEN